MPKPGKPSASADLLFEIGCEELPATNLADIFESAQGGVTSLEEKLRKVLEERRLSFAECRVWATPRRLVFWVKELAPAQAAKDVMTKLLPKTESFGADGKPTEKLLAILGHRHATVADTVIGDAGGKEYVFIKKAEAVKKSGEILPEALEALVRSLGFPKNMKWDDSGLYFPRPIRNYLCLHGAKVLRFKIGRTAVSDTTSFFSKGKRRAVKVAGIPAYFALLKKNGVILDPAARKAAIQKSLGDLASSLGVRLYEDPFLLNEVTFLVENPHALAAPFGEEFLKLPLEVLTVSMARKQRLFGVLGKSGGVQSRFLAVLDGPASPAQRKLISTNMENILHAKLQDSLFFYREDVKTKLEKKREELKNLVFLKGAGSMLEKSDRLAKLAEAAGADSGLPEKFREALRRAAHLSKADLLTQMVGEFPELQGVMGKYYALENGENEAVAEAIGEQYLPRTVSDQLPKTSAGALLSLLDKCDLVTACFGLGMEPSSSADPYGLRRSATAALKILVDKKLPLSLKELLAGCRRELGGYVARDKADALPGKLDHFFRDRFKALAADRGFAEDLVEAVTASGFERPYECWQRLEALAAFSGKEDFRKAAKIVERTVNILRGNKQDLPSGIDPALFAEDLERAVWSHYEASHEKVRQAVRARDFRLATSLYAEAFFDILEQFFEKVFVNAEDLNVRKNRLALLRSVRDLYTAEVADLSKIRSAVKPTEKG
ncbi:MAG TPA: glycine--tRNA ligase subunit beta [Candidatus Eisenbacteria bacterium]|nr:glycine--tRNA ligase subunit beta [Candidatus Eisenbacteria bacterium]